MSEKEDTMEVALNILRTQLAAEREKNLALALAVEKFEKFIRTTNCYCGYGEEPGQPDGSLCGKCKVLALPTNYKSILEDRDKRVRAEEWDSFIGLISGALAQGWDTARLLKSAKDAKAKASATIFEAKAEKGDKE